MSGQDSSTVLVAARADKMAISGAMYKSSIEKKNSANIQPYNILRDDVTWQTL